MAFTLLVTAETMAMARGATAPVTETILCTGHHTSVIHLDVRGNPTQGAHICPDCALFFTALQGDSSAEERHESYVTRGFLSAAHSVVSGNSLFGYLVRGPPFLT